MSDGIPSDINGIKTINLGGGGDDPQDLTLEQLVFLINAARVAQLQKETSKEFLELKDRQELVTLLQRMLKGINTDTDVDGTLDREKFGKVLQELRTEIEAKRDAERANLEKDPEKNKSALENLDQKYQSKFDQIDEIQKMADGIGADPKGKNSKPFTKEMRDRLLDNIRITIDDHNVKNDMQLQTVTRLTNERYETYQMARSIMKTLHDAKTQHARGITGR